MLGHPGRRAARHELGQGRVELHGRGGVGARRRVQQPLGQAGDDLRAQRDQARQDGVGGDQLVVEALGDLERVVVGGQEHRSERVQVLADAAGAVPVGEAVDQDPGEDVLLVEYLEDVQQAAAVVQDRLPVRGGAARRFEDAVLEPDRPRGQHGPGVVAERFERGGAGGLARPQQCDALAGAGGRESVLRLAHPLEFGPDGGDGRVRFEVGQPCDERRQRVGGVVVDDRFGDQDAEIAQFRDEGRGRGRVRSGDALGDDVGQLGEGGASPFSGPEPPHEGDRGRVGGDGDLRFAVAGGDLGGLGAEPLPVADCDEPAVLQAQPGRGVEAHGASDRGQAAQFRLQSPQDAPVELHLGGDAPDAGVVSGPLGQEAGDGVAAEGAGLGAGPHRVPQERLLGFARVLLDLLPGRGAVLVGGVGEQFAGHRQ